MKIRTGFISNSSTSSFIICNRSNKDKNLTCLLSESGLSESGLSVFDQCIFEMDKYYFLEMDSGLNRIYWYKLDTTKAIKDLYCDDHDALFRARLHITDTDTDELYVKLIDYIG